MKLVKELPEIFEEFGDQKRKSFLEIKEYKEKGFPVVGMYCAYFPTELAIAVGAIPVGLCSFSNETVSEAEQELPPSMCPLVKSSYGFAKSDKCPFFYFSDLVIGETTCDGKKKLYELLAEIKPVFVMELPNSQSERAMRFWKEEIVRTKEYFEEFFCRKISDEDIRSAIKINNEIRKALRSFCEIMKLNPTPITGKQVYQVINGTKYRFDFKTTPELVNNITNQILEEYQNGKMLDYRKRILITGCPIGGDTMKLVEAVEDNGGVVVAFENCSGVKTLDRLTDEENPDPYEALAKRYLSTGCSIMTPNDNRVELLGRIIDEYKVDGVIEMVLMGCHATGAESVYIRKFVEEEKKLPYMNITTDYSLSDKGQMNTKVGAFLEMIDAEYHQLDIYSCYKELSIALVEKETIQQITERIWKITGIEMLITDDSEKIEAFAGNSTPLSLKNSKDAIRVELEDYEGECIGYSTEYTEDEIKEVLELLARTYKMKYNSRAKKVKKSRHAIRKGNPDYLWLILDGSQEQKKEILEQEKGNSFEIRNENAYIYILYSDVKGAKIRDDIIEKARKWSDERDVRVTIGNGFPKIDQKEDNLKMLQKVYEIGLYKQPNLKLYLIEEFYQELITSYARESLDMQKIHVPELELLKKEDEENGTDFYRTFHVYLSMRRNMISTAAKLKIHRNTLFHRLKRIEELIGLEDMQEEELERLLMIMDMFENDK